MHCLFVIDIVDVAAGVDVVVRVDIDVDVDVFAAVAGEFAVDAAAADGAVAARGAALPCLLLLVSCGVVCLVVGGVCVYVLLMGVMLN